MNDDSNQIKKEMEEMEPEVDTDVGDDFEFEENTEVTGPDAEQKIKKLKEWIKELEKKNAELLLGWQRDKADFMNARRMDEENQKKFATFAKEDIILELLQTLDSFESAFKNKEAWEKVDKNWRLGVEYIHSQFSNVLAQHGLSVVSPLGEKFDHTRDEAIEMVPVEKESDDSKILEVVNSGYKLHDKLIRAPKVKVGDFRTSKIGQ
jgi:molecular chaperone GrpE